jgi:hypothetical protein
MLAARIKAHQIIDTDLTTLPFVSQHMPIPHATLHIMATFELSHQVATAKQQAKQLTKTLKTLHQTLKDTNTDTTILQDLNICEAKAQELSTESFLFIEKEAEKYISPSLCIPFLLQQLTETQLSARKITTFITITTISEVVSHLAKQTHLSPSKNSLAVLVLRYYFDGASGATNRKKLEDRLKTAETIGSLGDSPWTSGFEDVIEGYRGRLEKLAVEIVVEEVKGMVEGQVSGAFGVGVECIGVAFEYGIFGL